MRTASDAVVSGSRSAHRCRLATSVTPGGPAYYGSRASGQVRCGALRHQVGVGVSTRNLTPGRVTLARCAPASSRSGSLNMRDHLSSSSGFDPCAPASSRSGSLNTYAGLFAVLGTVCAPASSRSGSLNKLTGSQVEQLLPVRSGIKSEWESQHHPHGRAVTAPVVRSGIKSEWESQQGLLPRDEPGYSECAPASSRSGSLNPRPRQAPCPRRECAPASSRSGSLNGRATGVSTVVPRCAPASSRSGSLNLANSPYNPDRF